ncbi:MAG: type II toxin-antitoxin system HicB family antitoxin [Ignavibacteriales bacterium]|nr:MAG: type II toxin-antitoxin system HicB family antitoxin [Ignavibacteriales bacterium]
MKYKGYQGYIEFDEEAEIFHGKVIGIKDVITFQGNDVAKLKQAFKDSINDYLDFCKQRGEEPDKPFQGKLDLKLPKDLYDKILIAATRSGKNVNTWITRQLERAI